MSTNKQHTLSPSRHGHSALTFSTNVSGSQAMPYFSCKTSSSPARTRSPPPGSGPYVSPAPGLRHKLRRGSFARSLVVHFCDGRGPSSSYLMDREFMSSRVQACLTTVYQRLSIVSSRQVKRLYTRHQIALMPHTAARGCDQE